MTTGTGLRLNEWISSGTHAQRLLFTPNPATPASGPSPSAFWYEDDTFNMYAWNFAAATWNLVTGAAPTITTTLGITIDGGGSVPSTGVKGDLFIPVACTIVEAIMLADQTGSAVIDIWKAAIAAYPPVVGGSIVSAAPPTLSAANHSTDLTLTGWTTALAANDTLRFNLNSISTIQRVSLALKLTVP